jgi:small-conductance mechanosensitive channel
MNASVANANAGEDNCQVVTEIYLPLEVDVQAVRKYAIEVAQVSKYVYLNKPIIVLFKQEKLGHKVMLQLKVKAYVNEIRNEFAFMSEITELLTSRFHEQDLKALQDETFNE